MQPTGHIHWGWAVAISVGAACIFPMVASAAPFSTAGPEGQIVMTFQDSGPIRPKGAADEGIEPAGQGVYMLQVPTSEWTYGCSGTSAGMIFGYYDRNGYPDTYTGQANGGVAPLSALGATCSIIATAQGFDGRGRGRGDTRAGVSRLGGCRRRRRRGGSQAETPGTRVEPWPRRKPHNVAPSGRCGNFRRPHLSS